MTAIGDTGARRVQPSPTRAFAKGLAALRVVVMAFAVMMATSPTSAAGDFLSPDRWGAELPVPEGVKRITVDEVIIDKNDDIQIGYSYRDNGVFTMVLYNFSRDAIDNTWRGGGRDAEYNSYISGIAKTKIDLTTIPLFSGFAVDGVVIKDEEYFNTGKCSVNYSYGIIRTDRDGTITRRALVNVYPEKRVFTTGEWCNDIENAKDGEAHIRGRTIFPVFWPLGDGTFFASDSEMGYIIRFNKSLESPYIATRKDIFFVEGGAFFKFVDDTLKDARLTAWQSKRVPLEVADDAVMKFLGVETGEAK